MKYPVYDTIPWYDGKERERAVLTYNDVVQGVSLVVFPREGLPDMVCLQLLDENASAGNDNERICLYDVEWDQLFAIWQEWRSAAEEAL